MTGAAMTTIRTVISHNTEFDDIIINTGNNLMCTYILWKKLIWKYYCNAVNYCMDSSHNKYMDLLTYNKYLHKIHLVQKKV